MMEDRSGSNLPAMEHSSVSVKNCFLVRLMSPLGCYPADSLLSASAALMVSPDICFSIVRVEEGWSTEVDTLNAAEIPLFGSILLTGEAGSPYLYPYPTVHLIKTESLENVNEQSIAKCKALLLAQLQKKCGNDQERILKIHRPPIFGGDNYELVPGKNRDKGQLDVLSRLETAPPVILRGVNCLLKARMAFRHHELSEACCFFLWNALDAEHSLILQKLREDGNANPTSADAARYFEQITGVETDGEKFFEYDYVNRIRAIHPDNRFGAEAVPQLLADDFFELNDMLIPLFDFLVSELPARAGQTEATGRN